MTDTASRTTRITVTVEGAVHSLSPGQTLRIGRDVDADVSVQHGLVSRWHAVFYFSDGWCVADEGSTNGTFVNGDRIARLRLGNSAQLRLGDPVTGMLVTADLAPADADTFDDAALNRALQTDEEQGDATGLTVQAGPAPQPYRAFARAAAPVPAGSSTFTVGSSGDNDLTLRDMFVSRHHARLTEVDGGFLVEDLGSLNGTFLNGQPILAALMRDGDRLTIGHADFVRSGQQLVRERDVAPEAGGLDVRGLGFTIGGNKRLIHDLDLTARRGTLTAVIGPSGAGKSTLSRLLTGITTPTTGSVSFDEFDVTANYDIVSRRIGLVPQEDVLHRQLRVGTALRYAASLRLPESATRLERAAQVTRVVDQLGLDAHTQTRIDRLSGGQRKRASVALELLTEPSLLVLDEPTSGLDPALDRQVMVTLRELADDDRAVVVITHSVAYLELCDQVLVLAPGGMPAYLGPVSDIASHFGTADWAEIFAHLASEPNESHQAYRRRVPSTVAVPAPGGAAARIAPAPSRATPPAGGRWLRQWATLALRQVNLVVADVGYLIFLAVLPFMLGLLALVVPGSAGFTTPEPETFAEPSQLLALVIIGAAFMGASMSIRDLVSERPIFFRERAVGLVPSAYLLAKIVVFGVFSWISTGILVFIVLAGKSPPESTVVFDSGALELFIALGLTAWCSALLGLLVSSLVKSSDQAMPLLIVILMAQLVLHGGIIPVTGRAILDQVSWLIPARWGYAAAASGMDLETLVPTMDPDWMWEHSASIWSLDLSVVIAFAVVFALTTLLKLRTRSR